MCPSATQHAQRIPHLIQNQTQGPIRAHTFWSPLAVSGPLPLCSPIQPLHSNGRYLPAIFPRQHLHTPLLRALVCAVPSVSDIVSPDILGFAPSPHLVPVHLSLHAKSHSGHLKCGLPSPSLLFLSLHFPDQKCKLHPSGEGEVYCLSPPAQNIAPQAWERCLFGSLLLPGAQVSSCLSHRRQQL